MVSSADTLGLVVMVMCTYLVFGYLDPGEEGGYCLECGFVHFSRAHVLESSNLSLRI